MTMYLVEYRIMLIIVLWAAVSTILSMAFLMHAGGFMKMADRYPRVSTIVNSLMGVNFFLMAGLGLWFTIRLIMDSFRIS